MANRIDKRWKRVPPGTFKGRITIALTQEVDAQAALAAEFILKIFGFEPGDYAISDESDILDFMSIFDRTPAKYGAPLSANMVSPKRKWGPDAL